MNAVPNSHSERSEESGRDEPRTLPSNQGVIGQVVRADIAKFTTGCLQLLQTPPLGSLLKVEEGSTIFAVVCDARTESIDGRPPVPRLSGETDLESFLETHPHLRHLLQTTCDAVVVGHQDGSQIRHYLPSAPVPLFAPVRLCSAEEMARFSQKLDFLKLLLAAPTHSDEVTAACLRLAAAAHADGRAFLVRAGKELARLLGAEPQRLTSILRRERP